jgi:hypothetical protein
MGLTVRNGAPAFAGPRSVNLRESLLSIERALEDQNWTNLSYDRSGDETYLTRDERVTIIRRARRALRKNPLVKQAGNLLVNYTIGRGVSLTAANKTRVARIVDELVQNPTNQQTFFGYMAMSDFLKGAFTDGLAVLVMFPDEKEGALELGSIDPLLIEDVITDPDNWRIPKWVKVKRPAGEYDFNAGSYAATTDDEHVWYREWRNTDDLDPSGKKAPKKVEPGLVMLCRRGKSKLGESEVESALDWVNAHREFMENRATITRAAATFVWKKKRKNSTAQDIQAEVTRLQSSLQVGPGGYDANPPNAPGSTIVENDYTNLEWMKNDTGGANSLADERILRMMAGSGMGGIPNHYFGDEANANLATATAMELPLLKMYESWQKWLGDIISDVVTFALETAHEAGNLGPRDDAKKYSDRTTTAQQVLDTSSAKPNPSSPTGYLQAGPSKDTKLSEGDVNIHVKAGDAKVADAPSKPGAKPDPNAPDPNAPPPPHLGPPPPTVQPMLFTALTDEDPGPKGAIDWYVDVDFPPIVKKDLTAYFTALKALYDMMPLQNPEAGKTVLQMALVALEVNDVDQLMDRLFPPLPADFKGNATGPAAGRSSVAADAARGSGRLPCQAEPRAGPDADRWAGGEEGWVVRHRSDCAGGVGTRRRTSARAPADRSGAPVDRGG